MDQHEYSPSQNRDFITMHWGTKKTEKDTNFNTVQENKNKYSKPDVSRATLAQKLQRAIGKPSLQKYIDIVEKNLLPNCPVLK